MKPKPRHARRLRPGWTLIELLVVISIMGIMMAIGVLTFVSSATGQRMYSFANQLDSMMRFARNIAISQNTTASLTLDASDASNVVLYTMARNPVGRWALDVDNGGQTPGSMGNIASIGGASPVIDPAGRFGGCFLLNGATTINAGNSPLYDMQNGFYLLASFRLGAGTGNREIARRGNDFAFFIDNQGLFNSTVFGTTYPSTMTVSTESWTDLEVTYYNSVMTIRMGLQSQSLNVGLPGAVDAADLILGSNFTGWLDEVQIGFWNIERSLPIPRNVSVMLKQPITPQNPYSSISFHGTGYCQDGTVQAVVFGYDGNKRVIGSVTIDVSAAGTISRR